MIRISSITKKEMTSHPVVIPSSMLNSSNQGPPTYMNKSKIIRQCTPQCCVWAIEPPLWKIWVRQLGWLFSTEWENNPNVPNHQPDMVPNMPEFPSTPWFSIFEGGSGWFAAERIFTRTCFLLGVARVLIQLIFRLFNIFLFNDPALLEYPPMP